MSRDDVGHTLTREEMFGAYHYRHPFSIDLPHRAVANGVPVEVEMAASMLCLDRICDRRLRSTYIGDVWVSSVFIDTMGMGELFFESMTFGAYEEFSSKHDTIEEALEWHEAVVQHLREVRRHFKKYRRMKKWQKRLRQLLKFPLSRLGAKADQMKWLLTRLATEFPLSSRYRWEAVWAMESLKSAGGATNS